MKDRLLETIKSNKGNVLSKFWYKANEPALYQTIEDSWNLDYAAVSFSEKVYFFIYPDTKHHCKYGSRLIYNGFRAGYGSCGKKCKCSVEKREQTMLEKYGVRSPQQSKEIRSKTKKTFLEKYGSEELGHIQVEKRKSTMIERYGTKTPLENKNILNKTKQTHMERYGVSSPLYTKEVKEKIKISNSLPKPQIRKKHIQKNPEWYDEERITYLLERNSRQQVADILGCSLALIDKRIIEWNLTDFQGKSSYYEDAIETFLKDNHIRYIKNDRKTISPKEIDFLLPEHNIGLEFNGLHWHGEILGKKDRMYHLNKSRLAEEKGIQLIHIFQDEWDNYTDGVKSIILTICGKSPSKIYARKTKVKTISAKEANVFLDQYHLQGHSKSTNKHYGLFYEDELLSVMTFKPVNKETKEYELSRYCIRPDKKITGGASKLLKAFENDDTVECNTLITYSDNRYFDGKVYPALGFVYSHDTKPNYWYFRKANKKFHRRNFTKKYLVSQGEDKDKTEWQIMQELGYDRIWDCGNKKWIKKY